MPHSRTSPRADRWYRGVYIQVANMNSSGIRWFARTDDRGILRADTLAGIKSLIRDTER